MRILLADPPVTTGAQVSASDLEALYVFEGPLLRLNFVATLDGAATGPNGRSGSINSAADHRGFVAMRRAADAIIVGAGTARAENYGPARKPLIVISTRPQLPEGLRGRGVVLATHRASGAAEGEFTWLCGDESVALEEVVDRARAAFGPHLLCEGGPTLAARLLSEDLVDELGLSWTPHLIGGRDHPRILDGAPVEVDLRCHLLLEEDGTLLGLWQVTR